VLGVTLELPHKLERNRFEKQLKQEIGFLALGHQTVWCAPDCPMRPLPGGAMLAQGKGFPEQKTRERQFQK
jgi:hypothetical protein